MEFREVRDNPPLELDAQIAALPTNARCKGMFFLDVIEQARRADPSVDLHALAGVRPQRYLPVLDYDHADWMRLVAAAGSVLTQGRRPGEGVRTLGRHAFETLFVTPLGKDSMVSRALSRPSSSAPWRAPSCATARRPSRAWRWSTGVARPSTCGGARRTCRGDPRGTLCA